MRTEAQKRARQKYQKNNLRELRVQFYPADQELYDYARQKGNEHGLSKYVRELIRKDMDEHQNSV